jgi:hypothetical protein
MEGVYLDRNKWTISLPPAPVTVAARIACP